MGTYTVRTWIHHRDGWNGTHFGSSLRARGQRPPRRVSPHAGRTRVPRGSGCCRPSRTRSARTARACPTTETRRPRLLHASDARYSEQQQQRRVRTELVQRRARLDHGRMLRRDPEEAQRDVVHRRPEHRRVALDVSSARGVSALRTPKESGSTNGSTHRPHPPSSGCARLST